MQDAFENLKPTMVNSIISICLFLNTALLKMFLLLFFASFCWPLLYSAPLKLIIVRTDGNGKRTKANVEQIAVCYTYWMSGFACSDCLGYSVETVIRISA